MLGLLARLLALALRTLLFPWVLLRRARAASPSGWLSLELSGAVPDVAPPRRFWQRRRAPWSVHALRELASVVARDPKARGIVVTISGARLGMATATALRAIFVELRGAKKEVVAYLPFGADARECLVALGASQVLVGPQATLSPLGFAVTTPYVNQALTRVGVVPEVLARGRYKSAGESIMRDAMSDPQREQLDALVDVFFGALLLAVESGRRVDPVEAGALVDGAPYLGEDAVRAGLADAAVYDDEMLARVIPHAPRSLVPAARYLARRRPSRPVRARPVLGVVCVHGAIVQGAGTPWMRATDERVLSAVRRAREDPRVLGVVLHIDSPGGSALASDRMHHELVRLAKDKPLVACMSNVAASGGYYVAAAAHCIVAQPTTITGSIGVVAARVAIDPLLAKLGVQMESIARGAHAGLLHPTRPLSPDDRATLDRELDAIYRAFVAVVAAGRHKTLEETEVLAQGRVWSGKDAHARGLVDELGGFDRALELLRARVGAGAARAEPRIVRDSRRWASREERDLGRAAAAVGALGVDAAWAETLWLMGSRERVLAWAPPLVLG